MATIVAGLCLAPRSGHTASLIADIVPGTLGSDPPFFVELNGTIFFPATTPAYGGELWRTDGTALGTFIVEDINPGSASGAGGPFIPLGNVLLFQANDGVHGYELWRTDGTAAGTSMVRDIAPGSPGSSVNNWIVIGNAVFFYANDGTHGPELWRSDGTEAGTFMIKDICPGATGSIPAPFAALGSILLFRANDGTNGDELWRTDGTWAGTWLVKDIYNGAGSSSPAEAVVLGDFVYFRAEDTTSGAELWRSDGTFDGTFRFKDIYGGTPSGYPYGLTVAGGQIFFAAKTLSEGLELWASDGTTGGTRMVKDLVPGTLSGGPSNFTSVGNTVFFTSAGASVAYVSLWKSDGTTAGTVLVRHVDDSAQDNQMAYLTNVGGKLHFRARHVSYGDELWESDGTSGGTVVLDMVPGPGSSWPTSLYSRNGKLYFTANDPTHGREPWLQIPNTPPTLTVPTTQKVPAGLAVGPLAVVVDDTLTPPGSLGVTASSSNPALLPNSNILLGGSGRNRTVTLQPTSGQRGTADVSLSVSDGTYTTMLSFTVMWVGELRVGPGQAYTTIQGAIDAASPGDTVIVSDGIYKEIQISFRGKALHVVSENGPGRTAVDCEYRNGASAFQINSQETSDSLLQGFTITHCPNSAIQVSASAPVIRNCVMSENQEGGLKIVSGTLPTQVDNCEFRNNSSSYSGGGIVTGKRIEVRNSRFVGNRAATSGGAIQVYGVGSIIENCTFEGNTAMTGAGVFVPGHDYPRPTSSASIRNCTFIGNKGTGVYSPGAALIANSYFYGNSGGAVRLADGEIVNSTVVGNSAVYGGGGVSPLGNYSHIGIVNTILWGNESRDQNPGAGQIVLTTGATSRLGISHSALEGGLEGIVTDYWDRIDTLPGMIKTNPEMLSDGSAAIAPGSPCIDAGSSAVHFAVPAVDILGRARLVDGNADGVAAIDIGAFENQGAGQGHQAVTIPEELYFAARRDGMPPDAQTVLVRDLNSAGFPWRAAVDVPWLGVYPEEGRASADAGEISVSVDHSGLDRGSYRGAITISDPVSLAVLATVRVELTVSGLVRVPSEYGAIQDALDAAVEGDVVRIDDGTYTGQRNRELDFRGKNLALESANGPNFTTVDCQNSGRGFYIRSGEDSSSSISGLTFRNCSSSQGGGGHVGRNSALQVANCIFTSNSSTYYGGGGIYVWGSGTRISNCIFNGNTANHSTLGYGGALYVIADDVVIEGSTFTSNSAGMSGGGVYLYGSGCEIRGSVFASNRAIGLDGGAIDGSSSLSVRECSFDSNSAGHNGGAINNSGTIINSTFNSNSAANYGGAIVSNGSTVENTTFVNNTALSGAAAYGPYNITNTIFYNNTATSGGLASELNAWGTFENCATTSQALSGSGNFTFASLNDTPHFRSTSDFRLLHDSPCIDAGKSVPAIFSDLRGSVRAVDGGNGKGGAPDGAAQFDIGAYEYSEYYGGFEEDQPSKAFGNLRMNGSLIVTGYQYKVEWSDRDPFPFDRRIRQFGQYDVRIALVRGNGIRREVGSWNVKLNPNGYSIPVVFGREHIGEWRVRLELVADPNQFSLSSPISVQYRDAMRPPLGTRILPPPGALADQKPDIEDDSVCFWSPDTKRLYAIAARPTSLVWYADEQRTVPILTTVYPSYPEPQVHISGSKPVELLPSGTRFDMVEKKWADNDAVIASNQFTATQEGWAVLLFRDSQASDPDEREVFEVVRTMSWNHNDPSLPADPVYPHERTWDIGKLVTDPEHNQGLCGSGWVHFENALYDGVGEKRAYDRDNRTGRIFLVNLDDPAVVEDDLVVVWYQKSRKADACWPFKPVRYDPQWPATSVECPGTGPGGVPCDRIIIASAQGSGPLPAEKYGPAADMIVYAQGDRSLPGYNPNEEHAGFFTAQGSADPAVFPLRSDLSTAATSLSYVLLKYRDPFDDQWIYRVYYVRAQSATYRLRYDGVAGNEINPPYPLSQLVFGPCAESSIVPGSEDRILRDKDKKFFAKAGGLSGQPTTDVALRYFYRLQAGFLYDRNGDGLQDEVTGTCIPWLDGLPSGTIGTPVDTTYAIRWPDTVPTLFVGETLTGAKTQEGESVGLPNVMDQCVVQVLYDQSVAEGHGQAAKLIDPLKEYAYPAGATILPVGALGTMNTDPATKTGSRIRFTDLPSHLQDRLTYDAVNGKLRLRGRYLTGTGESMLLLNALTERDLGVICGLPGIPDGPAGDAFKNAVGCGETCTPQSSSLKCQGEHGLAGMTFLKDADLKALTAGAAQGLGHLTLAFNNHADCGGPTSLSVIKVGCPLYRGEIKVVLPENPFDEKVTLRHNGDFGGGSDDRWFQWVYMPADFSGIPDSPADNPAGWQPFDAVVPDALPPASGQAGYPFATGAAPFHRGAVDTMVLGSGQQLLTDKWFAVRYFSEGVCGTPDDYHLPPPAPALQDNGNLSPWTKPQLYEGWLKRVMKRINLFDQKVRDFHESEVDTLASMISLAGRRYEGDVALSDDPAYLNRVGLIELYETLLRRALGLSIDGTPRVNQSDLNKAVLLAANRLAGLYLLLGNEAFADAADPTIGFSTGDGQYGTEAPSIFSFQNQVDSLLEEELSLLRGRPDAGTQPFYNRLVWNFTIDDGEVAYKENYNVVDQNRDGEVNELDAMLQFPQGHGDAWGHYLTAIIKYYGLITHDYFTWLPQTEAILVDQSPVEVDYRDERRFAAAAAARARTGAELVGLTYRERYEEDPTLQWRGYKDEDRHRAWGLADWASRAGQGALFDWVVGNALLPAEAPPVDGVKMLPVQQQICVGGGGQRRFVIDASDYFRSTLEVRVEGALQAPSLYALTQEYDGDARDWDTVVTFTATPCPDPATSRTISFWSDLRREGIQKIDRTTVTELEEIASQYASVQSIMDQADGGLNPLGVAKDSVPFDIDPARVRNGETHFEQIYGRAVDAMNNAIAVFNHANQGSQLLRRQQDRLTDFKRNIWNSEDDFNNRLVEVFGYPYPDDCGPAATYPTGYCESSPDLFHYMYYDPAELTGETVDMVYDYPVTFRNYRDVIVMSDGSGASLPSHEKAVTFHVAADNRFGLVKPPGWRARRKAPGEIQLARADLLQSAGRLEKGRRDYENLLMQIEDQAWLLSRQYSTNTNEVTYLREGQAKQEELNGLVRKSRERELVYRTVGKLAIAVGDAVADGIPTVTGFIAGLANGVIIDALGALRAGAKNIGAGINEIMSTMADIESLAELDSSQAKEIASAENNILITKNRNSFAVFQQQLQIDSLIRSEAALRQELYLLAEAVLQSAERYRSAIARGERILADRMRFRTQTAAQVQDYRYKDMTFRIFRNDALQKYRAQFDMAARYVYLAAKAYDYETTLLDWSGMAGQNFLKDIVRQRTIGMVSGGQPLTGSGLADPMKRLWQNFQVLKGQLGFNNPQQETNRFSLREELLRIRFDQGSSDGWRQALETRRVEDLWGVPEFRRYCRPFAYEGVAEPGLVIPFRTTVTAGLNFFGWPLGGGDSYYSASNFATKVRSVGVWLSNYNTVGLAQTPRVYLVPAGEDVLRSPTGGVGEIRTWHVVDQKLPVPFPIDPTDLGNNPGWIPSVDTIHDEMGQIRRQSDFKAYHDSGYLDRSEMTYDTRLIGRSVWNTKWLLIIPGRNLLYDPDEGLETFIHGPEVIGGAGERTGDGITDIKLFFETYAYSGN